MARCHSQERPNRALYGARLKADPRHVVLRRPVEAKKRNEVMLEPFRFRAEYKGDIAHSKLIL